MYISDFKYHKPKTLAETLNIIFDNDKAVLLAGGTDLLVEIKTGVRKINEIVSLSGLTELTEINQDEKAVYICAGVTHNTLLNSHFINRELPGLAEAASKIGSHQIRNSATIGGNLCTGASCADTAPILMAYNAQVELVSKDNSRVIPLRDFFLAHHKTVMNKNEIMTKIIVPKNNYTTAASFEKFGLREASSISVVSSAVVMNFESDICVEASIVIGACGPVPIFCKEASSLLFPKCIEELIGNTDLKILAGQTACDETLPIDDIRGSAEFRRNLVKVLTKNSIEKAVDSVHQQLNIIAL